MFAPKRVVCHETSEKIWKAREKRSFGGNKQVPKIRDLGSRQF